MPTEQTQHKQPSNFFGATLSGVVASLVACGFTFISGLTEENWGWARAVLYVVLTLLYMGAVFGTNVNELPDRRLRVGPWTYVALCGLLAFALQAVSSNASLQPIIFLVPLVPITAFLGVRSTLTVAVSYLCLMMLGQVVGGWPFSVNMLIGASGFGTFMGFVIAFARLSFDQLEARQRADALAVDLAQQRDQLRHLNDVTAALAREEERNRLARELHDTIAQGLTAIGMQLEAAQKSFERDPARTRARLVRASQLTRETLADVRRSVWDLAAPPTDDAGFASALEQQTHQWSDDTAIAARYQQRGVAPTLDSAASAQVLRIVQEALKNVEKHAQATDVLVGLEAEHGSLRVSVQDNGVGIDPDAPVSTNGSGFGLRSLHERARIAGGQLQIESAPGTGTRVTFVRIENAELRMPN